jgi:hypothetical protein
MKEDEPLPAGVDASKPSPARMYDGYLGGTANFQVDRDAVGRILELVPEIRDAAWANRGFLQRAVRWMAMRGIGQFVDLGAGLPTQRCTHEVARAVLPDARVLYTDNDPGVVVHGHKLLAGMPGTAVIEADFREPGQLFVHPETRRLIDFDQPVGLLIVAVTQFIDHDDDPWRLVGDLRRGAGAGIISGALGAYGRSHGGAEGRPDHRCLRVVNDSEEHTPESRRDRQVLLGAGDRATL